MGSSNGLKGKTYPYPVCADCDNPILEGRIYKCEIPECPHSVCLNCVNMVAGMNVCNACYAKDYVGYQKAEGFGY